MDGRLIRAVSGTSWVLTGLELGRDYRVDIDAVDLAGNRSLDGLRVVTSTLKACDAATVSASE